ncbi:hypothetical protein [Kribbella italica]|uniref:Uncharacterized protein n=1 Tax=Kribbella italica TaxID=1540520 RepID=A0A7W9MX38_9ACTN|nr:hypothetical protein [Kribbella italica]MBB5839701.1 hypothetical protein [Kribbella italica]
MNRASTRSALTSAPVQDAQQRLAFTSQFWRDQQEVSMAMRSLPSTMFRTVTLDGAGADSLKVKKFVELVDNDEW